MVLLEAVGLTLVIEIDDNGELYGCEDNHVALDIPEGVMSIAPDAFKGSSVTKVVLPSTLSDIKDRAFWGCEQLREVDFSRCIELTNIGVEAFAFTGLRAICLPSSVKKIGDKAFMAGYGDYNRGVSDMHLTQYLADKYLYQYHWEFGYDGNRRGRKLPLLAFESMYDLKNIYIDGEQLSFSDYRRQLLRKHATEEGFKVSKCILRDTKFYRDGDKC